MTIKTMQEAENLVYKSYLRAKDFIPKADDSKTRDISLTQKLLTMAGNPDKGGRHILVTGSKGKGSTSKLIANILKQMGYNVGLFTSPHLLDFTERIQVNGVSISYDDFTVIMNDLEPAIRMINKSLPKERYLGPIGITLTAALLYFKMRGTDINVIECGRGGCYDEANVVANEWAVITPIMEEHLGLLGKTIFDICDHKLGIIKEATRAVFIGRETPEIMEYIEAKLSAKKINPYLFGETFGTSVRSMNQHGLQFNVTTDQLEYYDLTLPLLGEFQADNAAVAIKVCEAVIGHPLDPMLLKKALRSASWPGRCEIIGRHPLTILDGAINARSADYLGGIVQQLGVSRVVSIISVPEDKDYEGVIKVCARFSKWIIMTEPKHSHKVFPKNAEAVAKKYDSGAQFIMPFREALTLAREALPDLILIVGTQTFIGEVKQLNLETDIF